MAKMNKSNAKVINDLQNTKDERKTGDIPPALTFRHNLSGHKSTIGRMAWSQNGKFLATPAFDRTIRIWDIGTGQLLKMLKWNPKKEESRNTTKQVKIRKLWHLENKIYSVSWSPDSRFLASCMSFGQACIWDVATGNIIHNLEGMTKTARSISWSPDGSLVASGDFIPWVWNVGSGLPVEIFKQKKLSYYSINCVSWSPDGRFLATGGTCIQVLEAHTGQNIHYLKFNLRAPFCCISWSPDSQLLAACGDELLVLDTETGQIVRKLEGHTKTISSVSWSSDGRLLVSRSIDGVIRFWRRENWTQAYVMDDCPLDTWVPAIAFHPSQPVLATLNANAKEIDIWDVLPHAAIFPPLIPSGVCFQ
ncbi:MAG: WD40 repeat domain-containing protein [Gemmataceae bacterium]